MTPIELAANGGSDCWGCVARLAAPPVALASGTSSNNRWWPTRGALASERETRRHFARWRLALMVPTGIVLLVVERRAVARLLLVRGA